MPESRTLHEETPFGATVQTTITFDPRALGAEIAGWNSDDQALLLAGMSEGLVSGLSALAWRRQVAYIADEYAKPGGDAARHLEQVREFLEALTAHLYAITNVMTTEGPERKHA